MPLLSLALAWAAAAHAQAIDPQALVEAQRQQVRGLVRPGCRTSADPEEIIVCGRRDDRGPRGPLPALPYAPEPGSIPAGAQAGGEQRAAMANDRCLRLCHQPVQVNVMRVGAGGAGGAAAAIGEAADRLRDDE
jgi:hypothetical protein